MGAQRSQYSRHMSDVSPVQSKPTEVTEILVDATKGTVLMLYSVDGSGHSPGTCCPCYILSWLHIVERNGSGVKLRTLDYENPGLNPVLRC